MHHEPIRVLLIEDEPAQARLIAEQLISSSNHTFALESVETLAQGHERLTRGQTDVVLLDLSLPDSTGADSLLKIQAKFPDVPIVVLTSVGDAALGLRLVQAGAQDFLPKNEVTGALMARALRYAVERKKASLVRERLVQELQGALAQVRTLRGLLPICSNCKKIRDTRGYWHTMEVYIQKHSEAVFSHGLCPECVRKLYPGLDLDL
jgi:DNA-binding NarL/FixJ family response regulator